MNESPVFDQQIKIDYLKILSWNIFMLPHLSIFNNNRKRANLIAQNLKQLDYDIIIFQEAFDWKARKIIKRKLSPFYPFVYGPANDSIFSLRTNSGIWIISKIPLLKIAEIEFSRSAGLDIFARKGAVMYEGVLNGRKFQLIGTHLQSHSVPEIRIQQCADMYSFLLEKYSETDVPQIICGDFNISEDDANNYKLMLKTLHVENGSLENKEEFSYDEIGNVLAKRKNGKRYTYDYVLVRNNKLIKTIKRKISVLRHKTKDLITELSDHYGIEAIIDFDDRLILSHVPV